MTPSERLERVIREMEEAKGERPVRENTEPVAAEDQRAGTHPRQVLRTQRVLRRHAEQGETDKTTKQSTIS